MITEDHKGDILAALNREIGLLGSQNKVAKKLGVNPGHLSANLLNAENWHNVSETMWTEIASKLGVSIVNRGWKLAQTTNVKIMHATLANAQKEALFMAVSEKAGSGKSASIAAFVERDKNHAVYSLQCEEWSRKAFLINLASQLGLTVGRYDTSEIMTEEIVRFFKNRSKDVNPLLILDEADKLRPGAKRLIIPLYNKLEDQMGLVCVGTENLEKEIRDGVRRHDKGYDEIESRLGRAYVHLIGYSKQDVAAICQENGIVDPTIITKIWEACRPAPKKILRNASQETTTIVVEDARLIKRQIKKVMIAQQKTA